MYKIIWKVKTNRICSCKLIQLNIGVQSYEKGEYYFHCVQFDQSLYYFSECCFFAVTEHNIKMWCCINSVVSCYLPVYCTPPPARKLRLF